MKILYKTKINELKERFTVVYLFPLIGTISLLFLTYC